MTWNGLSSADLSISGLTAFLGRKINVCSNVNAFASLLVRFSGAKPRQKIDIRAFSIWTRRSAWLVSQMAHLSEQNINRASSHHEPFIFGEYAVRD